MNNESKEIIKEYFFLKKTVKISCLQQCLDYVNKDLNDREKNCLEGCLSDFNNIFLNN